ncbi:MAG: 5-oxoprolinase, partial [Hyphomicrobiales bacterium]|nr:5-oxoprolinase [Hyphomicrobiales bacterium]
GAIERFGHGTTVGLNALLTGTAARTAILTTRGFADTLEIGRMRRQTSGLNEIEVTDPYLRNRFAPLTPRRLVFEIDERINANGHVIAPLDETQARATIAQLPSHGVEAVAVCTLFSTINPAHELRLRELIDEIMPGVFVSLSHEISPNVGEYARMSTTAANAALGPLAGRYLAKLEEILRAAGMKTPVLMMTSAGGVLPTAVLDARPAYALFSGPAAGVMGSLAMGARIGARNVLTTDIGGTSFDVGAIVDGKPVMHADISVGGADIRVHSVDVDSIGAGGGSIARVISGSLRVGPQSAGANPGPACYGRGGVEPTSTDADLVLGVLDASYFIGGRMALDVEAARHAIDEKIAKPLGLSVIEAAWAIRQVLDSRMADLLRRMTIERGYDPRDFALFANGGAGPSHAWVLAAELGLGSFVVPAAATAQSAFGTANADVSFSTERPSYVRLQARRAATDDEVGRIADALRQAEDEVRTNLQRAGVSQDTALERRLSIRFRGQTNHLDVPLAATALTGQTLADAIDQFQRDYETLFGHGASYAGAGHEILNVRVTGVGALPPPPLRARGDTPTRHGLRDVIFDDPAQPVETQVWRTTFPAPGTRFDGPAIIEYPGQSAVLPPGSSGEVDEFGNLHVRLAP